jgi:hypothetical protein
VALKGEKMPDEGAPSNGVRITNKEIYERLLLLQGKVDHTCTVVEGFIPEVRGLRDDYIDIDHRLVVLESSIAPIAKEAMLKAAALADKTAAQFDALTEKTDKRFGSVADSVKSIQLRLAYYSGAIALAVLLVNVAIKVL